MSWLNRLRLKSKKRCPRCQGTNLKKRVFKGLSPNEVYVGGGLYQVLLCAVFEVCEDCQTKIGTLIFQSSVCDMPKRIILTEETLAPYFKNTSFYPRVLQDLQGL